MRPPDSRTIDGFLASSLKDGSVGWPGDWRLPATGAQLVERAIYHGVAGLLVGNGAVSDWPDPAQSLLRERAKAQAMWELRHRMALASLLEVLHGEGIEALLLKGTALAYDLYETPAERARGDTDLLVSETYLDAARAVLTETGFRRCSDATAHELQESWIKRFEDGSSHAIDLHWQLFNTPALRQLLSWDECAASASPLPRLAPHAFRPGRCAMLLHACAHSALHVTAPYFVDGITYYGGDRLIWTYDIHLLAGAFADDDWHRFLALAERAGLGPVCHEVLQRTQALLASPIPRRVLDGLEAMKPSPASDYLQARQFTRAVRDLQAIGGLAERLSYVRTRLFPPAGFLRAKYPRMARLPVALLHGRRFIELFRNRAS